MPGKVARTLPVSYRGYVPEPIKNGDHLTPSSRLWPDPENGPWLITFRWQAINGRAECIGIDVTSVRPADASSWMGGGKLPEIGIPLTTSVLRGVRLSELIAEERESMARVYDDFFRESETAATYRGAGQMREGTRRRLERVVEAYREAWQQGKPPTQTVAKRLNISVSAAAKLVARARQVGMLPPTRPGVAVAKPDDVSPST